MQQHRLSSLNEQLIKAAKAGRNDTLKELIEYSSAVKKQFSNIQLEEFNINAQNDEGATALYWTAFKNNLEGVNLLLDAKAQPDISNVNGFTPLMMAVKEGHEQIVDRLIKEGADINHLNIWGDTALNFAAFKGHKQVLDRLIKETRINVNSSQNKSRRSTALMFAASYGHTEIVGLLINSQAELDYRDNVKLTALDIAIRDKRLPSVVLLLQAKASINNLDILFNFLKSCDQANPDVLAALKHILQHPGLEPGAVAKVQIYYDKLIASSVNEACLKEKFNFVKDLNLISNDPLQIILFHYDPPLQTKDKKNVYSSQDIEQLYEENRPKPKEPAPSPAEVKNRENIRHVKAALFIACVIGLSGLMVTTVWMAPKDRLPIEAYIFVIVAEVLLTVPYVISAIKNINNANNIRCCSSP